MNVVNLITGILSTLAGIVIYWTANGFGLGNSSDSLGPSFYPKLLAISFVILGLILVWMSFRNKEVEQEKDQEEKKSFFHKGNLRVLMVIGTGIFYIIMMDLLGFIITTILLVILLMTITGERLWWKMGVTSVIVAFSLYLIFRNLLNVLLPAVPWM
ncbi:tripartite tricarboxylate transporter TctB family protein [Alteribacter populi]|uniref:tripartite tricarboxylate transporter TctB family protein n=1 Tax=Alteribacter populi TaxID=2011011 RepID=UPI0012FD55BD|nr:tripartite tricarboxylate transporter TctB family protein [Alteribacter populi]